MVELLTYWLSVRWSVPIYDRLFEHWFINLFIFIVFLSLLSVCLSIYLLLGSCHSPGLLVVWVPSFSSSSSVHERKTGKPRASCLCLRLFKYLFVCWINALTVCFFVVVFLRVVAFRLQKPLGIAVHFFICLSVCLTDILPLTIVFATRHQSFLHMPHILGHWPVDLEHGWRMSELPQSLQEPNLPGGYQAVLRHCWAHL